LPLLRHAGNLSRFRPRAGHDEATFLHGVCAVAAQDEFAFRWDNRKVSDGERAVMAVKGIEGKRLYYKDPIKKQEQ
jgi:hypothetical protein